MELHAKNEEKESWEPIKRDVASGKGVTLGLQTARNYSLLKNSKQCPQLTRVLALFASQTLPDDATFTAIQINGPDPNGGGYSIHVDDGVRGTSYIRTFGDFKGGGLYSSLSGVIDVGDKWTPFDGKFAHATMPYVGKRFSIILYTRSVGWGGNKTAPGNWRIPSEDDPGLRAAGFLRVNLSENESKAVFDFLGRLETVAKEAAENGTQGDIVSNLSKKFSEIYTNSWGPTLTHLSRYPELRLKIGTQLLEHARRLAWNAGAKDDNLINNEKKLLEDERDKIPQTPNALRKPLDPHPAPPRRRRRQ